MIAIRHMILESAQRRNKEKRMKNKKVKTQAEEMVEKAIAENKASSEKEKNVDFKVLLSFTKGKRHYVIMSVILAIIAAIASFVPYFAIYKIIEELLSAYPNLTDINEKELIGYGWIAFGGVFANVLLYFLALVCSHLAAFGTLYRLKVEFATHLARVPLGFHVIMGSGKLRKIMDDNIEKIEGFIAHQLPDVVAAIVAPVIAIAVLFVVDWRYGILCLIGIVISFVVQVGMYGKEGAKGMMDIYQQYMEEMNNGAVEYIRGISVIKAFNQTIHSFRSLKELIERATSATMEYTMKWKNPMSLFMTIINNLYIFIIPLGIILMLTTDNYVETLTEFIFYLMIVPAMGGILIKTMYASMGSVRIFAGVEKMTDILSEPELKEPTDFDETKGPTNFDIEFKNVEFAYNTDAQALKGMNFIAKENTVTALVGASGGGKSTVAHLIPRFFDVTGGSITIGGIDIRNMTSEYLMDKVSFVFQDVFLFKQSIRENIKVGSAKATDEDVYNAAKAAMCHDFIEALPQGYDTVIGAEGMYLSGGEMQRIAIARAIVKNSPIVVLDEATAFADPENEYLIQQALSKLLVGKTVIMIAHRLYTIKNAKNIVVVDDGIAYEQGTHQELLEKKDKYYDMWETYVKSTGWTMGKKGESYNA